MSKTNLIKTALLFVVFGFRSVAAQESPKPEPAHFHHVRLNVTDPQKTIDFYKKYFGAVEINYRHKSPALYTERSYILLNKVDEPPPHGPRTAISHIGWAAVEGKAEYEWLKSQGVEFQTHLGQLGNNYGMYVYGPDKELVELWTGGRNHRFDHVHLWASDIEKSAAFFRDHLGLKTQLLPKPQIKDRENIGAIRMCFIQCDNVGIVLFQKPDFESVWWPGSNYTAEDAPPDFEPTKGTVIDHIAFSYRNIEPVHDRFKAAGLEIVEPISVKDDMGHKSFYVMGPDKMLVEIVQEKPIPEGLWE